MDLYKMSHHHHQSFASKFLRMGRGLLYWSRREHGEEDDETKCGLQLGTRRQREGVAGSSTVRFETQTSDSGRRVLKPYQHTKIYRQNTEMLFVESGTAYGYHWILKDLILEYRVWNA